MFCRKHCFAEMSVDLHTSNAVMGTRPIIQGQQIESTWRSPFKSSKGPFDQVETGVLTRASDVELGVRIHIDHLVTVDYQPEAGERPA